MENLEFERQTTQSRIVLTIFMGADQWSVTSSTADKIKDSDRVCASQRSNNYCTKPIKDFRNILETEKCKGIESGRDNGNSGGVPLARECCGDFPRQ